MSKTEKINDLIRKYELKCDNAKENCKAFKLEENDFFQHIVYILEEIVEDLEEINNPKISLWSTK